MSNAQAIFVRRLRLAVKEASTLVQEAAQDNHRYTSHSGELEKSVMMRTLANGLTGEVYLETGIANYGPFVHEGTKAHLIFPRKKKMLRWFSNGTAIFAKRVHHPGTKKDPFLYNALNDNKVSIDDIFVKHTERAVEDVAGTIRNREYTWR